MSEMVGSARPVSCMHKVVEITVGYPLRWWENARDAVRMSV